MNLVKLFWFGFLLFQGGTLYLLFAWINKEYGGTDAFGTVVPLILLAIVYALIDLVALVVWFIAWLRS